MFFTESALGPLWSSSRNVRPSVCPLPMWFSQGNKGGPRGEKQSSTVASVPWKNVHNKMYIITHGSLPPPKKNPPHHQTHRSRDSVSPVCGIFFGWICWICFTLQNTLFKIQGIFLVFVKTFPALPRGSVQICDFLLNIYKWFLLYVPGTSVIWSWAKMEKWVYL